MRLMQRQVIFSSSLPDCAYTALARAAHPSETNALWALGQALACERLNGFNLAYLKVCLGQET
jgi:hypothetical protein